MRRRDFIVAGGVITASGLIAKYDRTTDWAHQLRGLVLGEQPSFTASMLRPDDLLALEFKFYNLRLRSGSPPHLERISPGDAFIVVEFEPQAIAEEAIWESDSTDGSKGATKSTKPAPGNGEKERVPTPPLRSRLADRTRIALLVSRVLTSIPFTDETLLDWVPHTVSVAANADPAGFSLPRPAPKEPGVKETAIEYPWRVVLSPRGGANGVHASWVHTAGPVEHDGRTELWHTRLGYRLTGAPEEIFEAPDPRHTVRAIWSPDWKKLPKSAGGNLGPSGSNFRTSLTPRERSEIVGLSSDFGVGMDPQPIKVNRLMLSSLGAWADLRGDFKPSEGFDVVQWAGRGTMGREHYAKVVKRGRLYPFGHAASLIKITERKFQHIQDGSQKGRQVAVLRQRAYIVVRERERSYPARDMPLKTIEITTDQTPDLNAYDGPEVDKKTRILTFAKNGKRQKFLGEAGFWPRAGNEDVQFHCVARDLEGARIEFTTPLVFVLESTLNSPDDRDAVHSRYNNFTAGGRRTRPLDGQEVAYAEPVKGQERSTAFKTASITFGSTKGKNFRPVMQNAEIEVPALKMASQGLGGAARAGRGGAADDAAQAGMALVKPAKAYVDNAFHTGQNAAQAYLETVKSDAHDTVIDYAKGAAGDLCGGLGQPNMALNALSRTLGPVGAKLDQLAKFDPVKFLGQYATFMGINFAEVLATGLDFPNPGPLQNLVPGSEQYLTAFKTYQEELKSLPSTLTETVYEEIDDAAGSIAPRGSVPDPQAELKDLANRIPKELRYQQQWEPKLESGGAFVAKKQNGDAAKMKLSTTAVVPLNVQAVLDQVDPQNPTELPPLDQAVGPPTYEVIGELTDFQFEFGLGSTPFLTIEFNRVLFEASQDQKPKVDVDINDVTFGGPLSFVEELKDFMSNPGNGLAIDVTASGVEASYTTQLPSLAMGAFSLQNMSIAGGVVIPFDNRTATARFAFCSREQPFLMTYGIFGGGGFAAIEVDAEGVKLLEASLEFGAAAAVDLGVASGSVQMMAGIYLRLEDGEEPLLSGYFRMNGEFDVLGLISASIEFYLTMIYQGGVLVGQATLTVEVDVLMFSGSVEVTCEKRFSRSSGGQARAGRGEALPAAAEEESQGGISFEQIFPDQAMWEHDYAAKFAGEAF